MRPLKSTTDDSDDEQLPEASAAVRIEAKHIRDKLAQHPESVIRLAAEIRCGNHPSRLGWLDYDNMASDATWVKMAACGNPTYVHKPSGWGVTLGQGNTAAIVSPNQLRPDALLTMAVDAVDIDRYGTKMSVFGLAEAEDAYDLADKYKEMDL